MRVYAVKLLGWLLKKIARGIMWRYRPGVIGITGSVGKTSTKLAIAAVLGTERSVRVSPESHNNAFGLPLTVIGEWSPDELKLVSKDEPPRVHTVRKMFFWFKVLTLGAWRFAVAAEYPEILILEYGIDRPGDMKALIAIARPNVSVVTAIGEIPAHVEFFESPLEVAREKVRLIECLPPAGFAILNADSAVLMELKDRTRARALTYGFADDADVRVQSFAYRITKDAGGSGNASAGRPVGISFTVAYGGNAVPVQVDHVFGKAHASAAAAAAAVGVVFGVNLARIGELLRGYRPAGGRMELLPGLSDTLVIHDAYNASPLSMHAALDTLRDLPGKRKIAVLGDMLEIGQYAMEAHERVGRLAGKFVNVLITVGPRAKFVAEGAKAAGMRKQNVRSFETAAEAAQEAQKLLKKGDLVLVKGSRAMHLEEAVAAIKAF